MITEDNNCRCGCCLITDFNRVGSCSFPSVTDGSYHTLPYLDEEGEWHYGTPNYFGNGQSYPSGIYRVYWCRGAFVNDNATPPDPSNLWTLFAGSPAPIWNVMFFSAGQYPAPTILPIDGDESHFADQTAVESHFSASPPFVEFFHCGGPIAMFFLDDPCSDNDNGNPNPSWGLFSIGDNLYPALQLSATKASWPTDTTVSVTINVHSDIACPYVRISLDFIDAGPVWRGPSPTPESIDTALAVGDNEFAFTFTPAAATGWDGAMLSVSVWLKNLCSDEYDLYGQYGMGIGTDITIEAISHALSAAQRSCADEIVLRCTNVGNFATKNLVLTFPGATIVCDASGNIITQINLGTDATLVNDAFVDVTILVPYKNYESGCPVSLEIDWSDNATAAIADVIDVQLLSVVQNPSLGVTYAGVLEVWFNATGAQGCCHSFWLDFGDGSTNYSGAELMDLDHIYPSSGTYSAHLKVWDDCGNLYEDTKAINFV